MIRRYIERVRDARRQQREDARALGSYRANLPYLHRALEGMDDIRLVLEQVMSNAGDGEAPFLHAPDLLARVRAIRGTAARAAVESASAEALGHIRKLTREIEGVGASWADERRRCTLSGGRVTLGELRAAKAFVDGKEWPGEPGHAQPPKESAALREAEVRANLILVVPESVLQDAIRLGGRLLVGGSRTDRETMRAYFQTLALQVNHMIAHKRTSGRVHVQLLKNCIEYACRPVEDLWTGDSALIPFGRLSDEVEFAIAETRK
jgi:hypothetical protein